MLPWNYLRSLPLDRGVSLTPRNLRDLKSALIGTATKRSVVQCVRAKRADGASRCRRTTNIGGISAARAVVPVVNVARTLLAGSRFLHQNKVKAADSVPAMDLKRSDQFRLTDYDCIGFDLDNTVCRYKVANMVRMEYNCIVEFLVQKKGYSERHLSEPLEHNIDFLTKGLILDVRKGNVLRLAENGVILHGSHGTTELTKDELLDQYGPELKWHITDRFAENPLCTWNGEMSTQMRTLLDYFDMPVSLIFARIVDTLDEDNGRRLTEYNIYVDILDALQYMFKKEHFSEDKGGYFPFMKYESDKFIHKCSDSLMQWFKDLRKRNKILFLITGSNYDFASHTASYSMGPQWRDIFDIVICFAKKPGFFTENRSFMALDGFMETNAVLNSDLRAGEVYTYGNWAGLYGFLKRQTSKAEPKVVYIGDNLIQDVYTPNMHSECDTIAICEELEAEGIYGYHDRHHHDDNFLVSNRWGSYFDHSTGCNTLWKDIIKKHSKLCVPSLEYLAEFSIDFDFHQHNLKVKHYV